MSLPYDKTAATSPGASLNGRRAFSSLVRRDLTLAFRSPGQALNPVAFYLMVASLFPMGITPQKEVLSQLAGGIIWIGALLAVLLSLDSLFKSDHDDGSLEQLLLSPPSSAVTGSGESGGTLADYRGCTAFNGSSIGADAAPASAGLSGIVPDTADRHATDESHWRNWRSSDGSGTAWRCIAGTFVPSALYSHPYFWYGCYSKCDGRHVLYRTLIVDGGSVNGWVVSGTAGNCRCVAPLWLMVE